MNNTEPKINNLFLLGAGFTRAVFPEAPLNKDLFHEVVHANPKTKLNLYSKKYGAEDIEILLTRLDLEIAETASNVLEHDRRCIEMDLVEYFSRFRFVTSKLDQNPWLEKFALEVLCENDGIVTTNYDCFLEGVLDFFEVWSPKGGYVNIENMLLDSPENSKNILIYKIHGSGNFWISPTYPNQNKEAIGLIIDESIFPRSGKNRHFRYGGGQDETRSYIIAPSFVKIPAVQIADMINKAIKVAPYAKNMIIGGSSLRPEDKSVWLIITSFMNKQLQMPKSLIIISPSATAVERRIKNYWIGSTRHLSICSVPKPCQDGIGELLERLNNCEHKE